jgi:hypothetical protein
MRERRVMTRIKAAVSQMTGSIAVTP